MPTKIVPVSAKQLPALHETLRSAFGGEPVDEIDDRHIIEPERFFAVADGDRLVASAGAYSFALTLPGGTAVPVAGVTWVAVLPTHRRQGILRKMMKHQLDDVAARGESIAVLTASEGAIYSRFGYGVGAQVASVELPRRAAFHVEPTARGSFSVGGLGDDRIAAMAAVYQRWAAARPGAISRAAGVWKIVQLDRSQQRFGGGIAYTVAHHDRTGAPDGYARYRYRETDSFSGKVVLVTECIAADPEVEAALWRYLLDLDLTATVRGLFQPVDDPLQWRLVDPRAYTVKTVHDWLWVRVLDVAAALTARSYATDGSVVLELVDEFRPRGRAAGRFALDASPDGATCKRTKAAPDVTLPVDVLGSLLLGAVPLSVLVRAGRATVSDPGITLLVDELFRSSPMPFCNTPF